MNKNQITAKEVEKFLVGKAKEDPKCSVGEFEEHFSKVFQRNPSPMEITNFFFLQSAVLDSMNPEGRQISTKKINFLANKAKEAPTCSVVEFEKHFNKIFQTNPSFVEMMKFLCLQNAVLDLINTEKNQITGTEIDISKENPTCSVTERILQTNSSLCLGEVSKSLELQNPEEDQMRIDIFFADKVKKNPVCSVAELKEHFSKIFRRNPSLGEISKFLELQNHVVDLKEDQMPATEIDIFLADKAKRDPICTAAEIKEHFKKKFQRNPSVGEITKFLCLQNEVLDLMNPEEGQEGRKIDQCSAFYLLCSAAEKNPDFFYEVLSLRFFSNIDHSNF